ncbi:Zn-dependent oxidoreductase [Vibrio gazogenes]|uniref:L-gulonate 5-dehydrogenase n=1 Tax=Vibrio gazogenes DSM 21264 = NBRC 103151 TaxID=1123492 RepID=A0A1M5GYU4_VIBGA|nr:Zn-dependent oxidoreductase [Vibrio gazogenes]USP15776.1 Zn-dependent oxidoreductase [Vibrio gazogenes]SHG08913.1 L-gulonate 5-dehydrogenase [Vibrio gazogenes DSM 21264] [Vibrio gazogenes DSM 21264 = NBRC 103151]SJN52760.1 putative zinc-type alcohol dehydrogenase-like protein YjmD [Vibrio gazogenes]
MKALVVQEPNQFMMAEKTIPQCGDNDVLVKVAYAGICGSDMHILHGHNPFVVYPRTSGHEFSGTVAAVGSKVSEFALDDHVVVDPVISCGHCRPCRHGRVNTCLNLQVIGVHRDGGFSQYQVVPASNVYKISKQVPLKQAALVEPYTIAANVFDRLRPCDGDTILIYGAGVIGLTLVQVAKVLGIPSIVVDIVDEKLAIAKQLGAAHTLNSKQQDVEAVIMEMTQGEGVPLIADAACIPSLVPQILRLAAPAGAVCLLGFLSEPSELAQIEVIKKELTIVGSRLNNKMFSKVIPWIEAGQLNTEAIVSHEFAFENFSAAVHQLETSPESSRKIILAF